MDQAREARRLLEQLNVHPPFDADEAAHLTRLRGFLEATAEPFARATAAGHVTASCFVLSPDGREALLLHHRALGRWLQPGGHCEPASDRSHLDATRRELREETGLGPDQVDLDEAIFDVDVHLIPARGATPAHPHFDVRRRARLRRGRARRHPDEALALRWLPLEEVARWPDPSLARMARKALAQG